MKTQLDNANEVLNNKMNQLTLVGAKVGALIEEVKELDYMEEIMKRWLVSCLMPISWR